MKRFTTRVFHNMSGHLHEAAIPAAVEVFRMSWIEFILVVLALITVFVFQTALRLEA